MKRGYAAYHTYKTGTSLTSLPSTQALTRHGCTLYTIQRKSPTFLPCLAHLLTTYPNLILTTS